MTHALRLTITTPPASYPYVLGDGVLATLGDEVARVAHVGVCALVTDLGVAGTPHLDRAEAALRAAGFTPAVHVLAAGEAAKTVEEAEKLWEFLAESGCERRSPIVALGGGAVGDLAGFCAATWMRGVPLVQVPTTILSMADSSVGGKSAIDLPAGKNLVGAVHQPSAVVADLQTLATLPEREIRSGFAEIVKCAVLDERARLAPLRAAAPALLSRDPDALTDAIGFAVRTKELHIAADPHDLSGRRALLNLGHTVAHSLEVAAGYGTLLHGEAVSVGLVVALQVARAKRLVGADLLDETRAALGAFGLPLTIPAGLQPSDLVFRTRSDKKRAGARRRMVLPMTDGGAALFEVTDAELEAAIRATRG